ncbi:CoA-binding protein [Janthinobacterium sp.]|uniref:CoA-binding protein n=1 Tax=Janthinobacterium sp. TaxID=1871054 RepID=UPI00293D7ED9|nr:CoA-binding protein [Janthinobacterium sp.]
MSDIARILADSRIIAVVGLSANPHRPSFEVAAFLQARGYRILPVNPGSAGQDILGELCHATLAEAAAAVAPARIDIVDCFRKAEDIMPIARQAIAVKAGCLWMQLGIVNEEAAALARAAGLRVVMNHCPKIELTR